MRSYVSDEHVDTKFRSNFEFLFTQGAEALIGGVPVISDTDHAEVVSTACGYRLCEDFQTDGAPDMLLREEDIGRHYLRTQQ